MDSMMKKIVCVLFITSVCGCKQKQAEVSQPESDSSVPTVIWKPDRRALDLYIDTLSDGSEQRGPRPEDHALASSLNGEILKIAEEYIVSRPNYVDQWKAANWPYPSKKFQIVAARIVHGYILLDVRPTGLKASNSHLVYSPKEKKVVRRFTWYIQL